MPSAGFAAVSMKDAVLELIRRDADPPPVHEHLHAARRNLEARGSAVRVVATRLPVSVQEM